MKLLTVSALLCAVIALTTAARQHHVEKRAICCPHGWTKACESVNANLASVRNIRDYYFIRKVIYHATHANGETWIGGSDGQVERYWFWIDGTRFSYTRWCHTQPDNFLGNQNCMTMNWLGQDCWDDQHCGIRHPYVCVKNMLSFLG
ncbi:hypothetical protein ACER0C_001867 [Sarotherodon galilaeus]